MPPRALLALSLAHLASVLLGIASAVAAPPETVIGAYYPGDSVARYPVEKIPTDKITHLFYAFAHIEDGQCAVAPDADAHFTALAKLKRQYPHLRTLISIGGWGAHACSHRQAHRVIAPRLVAPGSHRSVERVHHAAADILGQS